MADASTDLPLDLLPDISRRLHAATDYVRFHAVCRSWREDAQGSRPALLPWLLSPRDAMGHRKARCVFSSKSSRSTIASVNGLCVPDRAWAIGADDGAAAFCLFTTCPESNNGFVDPLAGLASSVALPPYPEEMKSWVKRATGVVSGDGTVFVHALGLVQRWTSYVPIFVALLHPGDAAWTLVKQDNLYLSTRDMDTCCVAYHDGKIVKCHATFWWRSQWSWTIVSTQFAGGQRSGFLDAGETGKKVQSSYLVESHGELLWVFVQVKTESAYYKDVLEQRAGDLGSMPEALVVSVYALQYEGGEPRWVERDGRSFADRILFLGKQGSFAVDAARFGIRGCAYFLDRRHLYGRVWSKSPLERSRVYKYSFHDDKSELVEQLPAQWKDIACMWLTPQPAMASTEEIRKKLAQSRGSTAEPIGSYYRIYVGNLTRKMDGYRLRQFFSKHGNKVADVRIMYDRKTRRSRGFGFVTIMAAKDEEPADFIAKLHGQSWMAAPCK